MRLPRALSRPGGRIGAAVLAGVVQAVLVAWVLSRLGYPVGMTAETPLALVWGYGGLVILGAVPVWASLRYRMVTPAALLVLFAVVAFALELTPPAPSFQRIGETLIVTDGLYLIKYRGAWVNWLLAAMLGGLVEYGVRTAVASLPDPSVDLVDGGLPVDRGTAIEVGLAVGIVHSTVVIGAALGSGFDAHPATAPVIIAGTVLLAGIPTTLLLGERLLAPLAAFVPILVGVTVRQSGAPASEGLAVPLVGWYALLAGLLVLAGIECGLRQRSSR